MKILALMENMCTKRGLRGEHGLSFWIEHEGLRILFDSGQTGAFLDNADSLGIDLLSLDAVVLSHGHYDHAGGLVPLGLRFRETGGIRSSSSLNRASSAVPGGDGSPAMTGSSRMPLLYAGPGFDLPRSSSGAPSREVGIPEAGRVRELFRIETVPGSVNPGANFFILRAAGDGLSAGARLIRTESGESQPDHFEDELTLVLRAAQGLVVITGCAHRGVLSILDSVTGLFPGEPILAFVGGLHLVDMGEEEINAVAASLAAKNVARIYCDHCTGTAGFAALALAMPGRVSWFACGARLEF